MCYGASRRKEELYVSVCQLYDTIFLRSCSFQVKKIIQLVTPVKSSHMKSLVSNLVSNDNI